MISWRDRINRMSGKTRYVVCRLFLHLGGEEITPLLGTLNEVCREAIAAEGDLDSLGEGLAQICQNLLQITPYWRSAANEGDVFWDEGEAGDYVNELFTDSASRYLSESLLEKSDSGENEPLSLAATQNLVIMITVAYTGETEALETDLAEIEALEDGLKEIVNLHYQGRLEAAQIHFSPAKFGDQLTDEQVLLNFPELIPL